MVHPRRPPALLLLLRIAVKYRNSQSPNRGHTKAGCRDSVLNSPVFLAGVQAMLNEATQRRLKHEAAEAHNVHVSDEETLNVVSDVDLAPMPGPPVPGRPFTAPDSQLGRGKPPCLQARRKQKKIYIHIYILVNFS